MGKPLLEVSQDPVLTLSGHCTSLPITSSSGLGTASFCLAMHATDCLCEGETLLSGSA